MSSPKIYCTGHAINIDKFSPLPGNSTELSKNISLLVLGRISPIKDIETVLRAALILKNTWRKLWKLSIVGGPLLPRDQKYLETLKVFVKENGLKNKIDFVGPVLPQNVPRIYNEHDIFISMSGTGSIDKSVLEAMASGCSVVTANEAFSSLLPAEYFLEKREPKLLAERLKTLAKDKRPNNFLRSLVVEYHGLPNTIKKIADILKQPHI
jgi:glycosyltransferase involved in cell wall biosynthesis